MNDGTRYRPTTMLRLNLTTAERRLVDLAVARLDYHKAKQAAEKSNARGKPRTPHRRDKPRAA